MKYKVLRAGEMKDLERKVRVEIREGWTPLGGVSVCPGYGHAHFHQAMIKEEQKMKEEKKLTHEEIKEGMEDALQWICGVIDQCKMDPKKVVIQDLLDVLFDIKANMED